MLPVTPLIDEPALAIEGEKKTLVVADTHVGIEYELLKKGINIPHQTEQVKSSIERLIRNTGAHRLILLGDIKHNIPAVSVLETKTVPRFLDFSIPVDIIKGNHDGSIEALTSVPVHPYMSLDGILLSHGHRNIPDVPFETLIVGHSHPAIEITDELGNRTKEKCWIRGQFPDGRDIIIVPAFNPLITGIAFNGARERIPGSLFRLHSIEELSLTAYLLDGTYLGYVADIT
jgi:hypothetical protein